MARANAHPSTASCAPRTHAPDAPILAESTAMTSNRFPPGVGPQPALGPKAGVRVFASARIPRLGTAPSPNAAGRSCASKLHSSAGVG